MQIISEAAPSANVETRSWEIVERKGIGHPDTLADGVAEAVSGAFSTYCLDHFGLILHHNADKTALLGGKSRVRFGGGEILEPISVNVNGRFSTSFDGEEIPCNEIIDRVVRQYLHGVLPLIDPREDIDLTIRNNVASSPGFVDTTDNRSARARWFQPRDAGDVPDSVRPHANDTSCGVGYAPLSALERFVLQVETMLRTGVFPVRWPAVGTDIKLMAVRRVSEVELILALPVIDRHVANVEEYAAVLDAAREAIESAGLLPEPLSLRSITVNARDDLGKPELYLTVVGSSIESGDEGLVGRGNRTNGLITPMRTMSIEGACGKNPMYHVGKLYNIVATDMAETLHRQCGEHVSVGLVSKAGAALEEPSFVGVHNSGRRELPAEMIEAALTRSFAGLEDMRERLLAGKYAIY